MASRGTGWRVAAILAVICLPAAMPGPAWANELPKALKLGPHQRPEAVRSKARAPANAGQSSLDQMPTALAEQLECLALNIYWEARSEPATGQLAVAAVTLNRVADPRYPDNVCQVVYQGGEGGKKGCQFSWWCDGKPDQPREPVAWARAVEMAFLAVSLDRPDPTGGALWYHADYVDPRWARSKLVVARIGRHLFLRDDRSADELLASAR